MVGRLKIHTADALMAEPSAFEVEMVIEKLKRDKSQGTDQILAEMVKTWGRTIHFVIHKLFTLFGIRSSGRSRLVCMFIRRRINWIEAYHLSTAYQIVIDILLSVLTPQAEEIIGDHQGGY